MRILFITPPPSLPNRLHRIRAFDLIKILSKKHQVYLLSVFTKDQNTAEFKELKDVCKNVKIIRLNHFTSLLNVLRFPLLPAEVAYCYSKKVTREINKLIKRYKIDLLYLKRLRSAIYLPPTTYHLPSILDTTDAMSMFYFRMFENNNFPKNLLYLSEAVKYRLFEKKVMEKFKNWVACSDIDKKYLETLDGKVNVYTVPNPVDTQYFNYKTDHPSQRLVRLWRKSPVTNHSLLFRGLMDKPVNIDAALFFVHQIFPLIQKSVKNIKLFIVGPSPTSTVKRLDNGKNIFVTGFLKDVREYIKDTDISVCPIRIGSGTRYKILQSWSMGRPVVSTTEGAEGLKYVNGENILIADSPKKFARKVVELLTNRRLYNKFARRGRATALNYYSFYKVGEKLEYIVKYAKKRKGSSSSF